MVFFHRSFEVRETEINNFLLQLICKSTFIWKNMIRERFPRDQHFGGSEGVDVNIGDESRRVGVMSQECLGGRSMKVTSSKELWLL